ncbi:MAG: DUF411 domain-containing protein [Gammaproteobacteria bacterium]|nr:DUF411 domain-containing protein [Gammaproteobacteria bacterium]
MLKRRSAAGLIMAFLLVAGGVRAGESLELPVLKVWKTPSCGCCGKWVRHMEAAGFRVEVTDLDKVDPIKKANGVPLNLASCHTATVGGYVIEGHVPASDVRRLLKEKPGILGLTAPGMPAGSPGMDAPGAPAYDVLSLGKDGKTTVYATHGGNN